MSRPLHTLRRNGALAALALLLCFGGGQVLQALHQLVQEHEVCAHGEVVHAVGHDPHADKEPRVPEFDEPGVGSRQDAAHAHDHCGHTLASHEGVAALHSPSSQIVPTLRAALLEGRMLTGTTPSVTLYLIAPKASPPV